MTLTNLQPSNIIIINYLDNEWIRVNSEKYSNENHRQITSAVGQSLVYDANTIEYIHRKRNINLVEMK